ncbi:MAG: hypothetical protein WC820_03020 [Spirochaetales bacterium]|jgi:hypothetical protein
MKRNQIALLLGAVLIVMVMGSCDSLFTNQFQTWKLGQVSKDSLVAAAASGDVTTLIAESGLNSGEGVSPSFLAAATVDQETADAVVNALQDAIDAPGATNETIQASEALIVEIQLEVSGGKEFIDNIVTAIGTIDFNNFNPVSNPSDLASLLSALFPARSAKTLPAGWSQGDIAAVIDAIVGVNGNLSSLAGTLTVDQQYLISGIDAGWLAQVGIIVAVLQQINYVAPYESIGGALAALLDDPDIAANYASYISVDPDTFLSNIQNNADLQALFTAAGLSLDDLLAMFNA